MFSSNKEKFNQVDMMKIWKENIKKERINQKLPENAFAIYRDPKSIHPITNKPSIRGKKFLNKDEFLLKYLNKQNGMEVEDDISEHEKKRLGKKKEMKERVQKEILEDVKAKLSQTPKDIFSKPMTTSQDYGWFSSQYQKMMNVKKSGFYKGKSQCSETKYANKVIQHSANLKSQKRSNTGK